LVIGLLIPLIALAFSPSTSRNEQVITPPQEEAAFDEHNDSNRRPHSLSDGRPVSVSESVGRRSEVPETPEGVRHYTQEEVIQLIHHWAEYFSVPVEHPLRIARCESNYRWDAKNRSSSASGVFQYLSGSWANTFEGKAGASVFDANANITAAIRHMSIHGYDAWECK